MVCEQAVKTAPGGFVPEVSFQHRVAQDNMEEVPLCLGAALDHVGSQRAAHARKGEVVPIFPANPGHQHAQVALPPTCAAEGDQVRKRPCPRQPVQTLCTCKQLAIDTGDMGRELGGFGELERLHARGALEVGELALGAVKIVGLQQVHFLEGKGKP